MEVHEVCSIFPPMTPDEFAALKEDIAANGQREPVWIYRGKVIDGRNRLKACAELGISPKTREWDGVGSLVAFVMSLNLNRRHLTPGQRAAVGAELKVMLAAEAKERQRAAGGDRCSALAKALQEKIPEALSETVKPAPQSRDEAARIVGVNPRYVQDASNVMAAAPELHERVKAGTMTLPQARREVQRMEKRADLEAKAEAASSSGEPSKPAWEIVTGDCLVELAKIEPGSARLVFADPPYNIGVRYGNGHNDRMRREDYEAWTERWMTAAARTLAPDGSMWVLINNEWADVFGCLLRKIGLHRRSWVVWYEAFGVNVPGNFNRTSRHLLYMVKDPERFVFHADAVSRLSDRQAKYHDNRADPGGKTWDDVWGLNPMIPRLVGNDAERLPDFPTQLPLDLLSPIVGCASDPGDLVVDPFNGSGTTGAAAIRLGRRYLGIEQSEAFARASRSRLGSLPVNEV